MHGLIFRTIECFVSDSFGPETWVEVLSVSDIQLRSFEAMLDYDSTLLPRVLNACAMVLDRPRATILEDIGTYLITHQNHASIRRLMRFGGHSFVELVQSLDELPGRSRLAVPGLDLPNITVEEHQTHQFTIRCDGGPEEFGHMLVGLLRAMADDYGALAVLDHLGTSGGTEVIEVSVVDSAFADDRGFSLAADCRAAAT